MQVGRSPPEPGLPASHSPATSPLKSFVRVDHDKRVTDTVRQKMSDAQNQYLFEPLSMNGYVREVMGGDVVRRSQAGNPGSGRSFALPGRPSRRQPAPKRLNIVFCPFPSNTHCRFLTTCRSTENHLVALRRFQGNYMLRQKTKLRSTTRRREMSRSQRSQQDGVSWFEVYRLAEVLFRNR